MFIQTETIPIDASCGIIIVQHPAPQAFRLRLDTSI